MSFTAERTFENAELGKFRDAAPPLTTLGANHFNQRANLAGKPSDILDRQIAVAELYDQATEAATENSALAKSLKNYAAGQAAVERTVNGDITTIRQYTDVIFAFRSLRSNFKSEDFDSPYLQERVEKVRVFNTTDTSKILSDRSYFTRDGLSSKDERHMPWFRFTPGLSGRFGALGAVLLGASATGVMSPETPMILTYGLLLTAIFSNLRGPRGEVMKDASPINQSGYRQLGKRAKESPELQEALCSIAELDGILALAGLKRAMEANGYNTVFPDISDADSFEFTADNLFNPVLALSAAHSLDGKLPVIPNTVNIGPEQPLTFVTGPNSGGKSTYSKSILQAITLGRMGGALPADSASMTVADKIAYHLPVNPDLGENVGRLQFELDAVKKILDGTTPKSLVVLDDCLEGTSYEESLETTAAVLYALRAKGVTVVYSTHAQELARRFNAQGIGQHLQIEFKDERPTHRIIPGISEKSHAARIVQESGLSIEQTNQWLDEQGLEKPNWI